MSDQETRSPWSTRRGSPDDVARRGELRQGGPFRADSGHIANHVGKNAITSPRLRADFGATNEPVQGGRRNVIE